jgi:hypothetical protein
MAKRKAGSQIWQFDFRPLKVENRPDYLVWRFHATYHWKAFDKGYNFGLDLISIRGLHTKLGPRKVARVLTLRISGLPLATPGTKWHLVLVMWPNTKYIIRGKVVASLKYGLWWFFWVRVYLWLVLAPKTLKLRTNQLIVWFVQVRVSNWCLSFFLVPILELQHAPLPFYPQSVVSQGACPNYLFFRCFHFKFTFESIKELGSVSRLLLVHQMLQFGEHLA